MTFDPHPLCPAAQGWEAPATAPETAKWVQLAYVEPGAREPAIIVAHWACDLSGEEQPPFKGWFRATVGDGGRTYGFTEVPKGWVAWRPLWPAGRADEAAAHEARVAALIAANNLLIEERRIADGLAARANGTAQRLMDGAMALSFVVSLAEIRFREYARLHTAKGTPDADAKAASNQAMAERLHAALRAHEAALLDASVRQPDYQGRVHRWMLACFGPEITADHDERKFRFLEEALELVQAAGCTREDAERLVAYVYGRPAGALGQEAGGVAVTLAALCTAYGISLDAVAEIELTRVWGRIDQIRKKQAAKPIRSPLPGPSAP